MDLDVFRLVFLPSLSWFLLCPQMLSQMQPKIHFAFLENSFSDFNSQQGQHPQKNSNGHDLNVTNFLLTWLGKVTATSKSAGTVYTPAQEESLILDG